MEHLQHYPPTMLIVVADALKGSQIIDEIHARMDLVSQIRSHIKHINYDLYD